MLYLSGCIPAKEHLQHELHNAGIGAMLTPFSQRHAPAHWTWAADNGCFATRWDATTWLNWLKSKHAPETAVFATVPDVVSDHHATLLRWEQWFPVVKDLGYKPAFVLQDGAKIDDVPWDELEVLFIGGSTDFKLSSAAAQATQHAKQLGKWVHMGRVNSYRRMKLAKQWDVDSTDGTYLAFGPDVNTPRLLAMLAKLNHTAVNIPLPFD